MACSERLEQHAWLQRLVGTWRVSARMFAEPGAEPVPWETEEEIRPVGAFWIVAEGRSDGDGEPYSSRMTLGYDPRAGTFVGTWIDSMQSHMWNYVGHLDDDGRALTLEAEGPSLHDPSKRARYRDRIELVAPDHRRMVSSVRGEDGEWAAFMTSDARRVSGENTMGI